MPETVAGPKREADGRPGSRIERVRAGRLRGQLPAAVLLLAPAIVVLGLVFAYPIVQLVQLSTQDVVTYNNTFDVGLANYRFLLEDPGFRHSLGNSLRLMLAVPLLLGLSVLVAAGLHERWRGWQLQRGLIFLLYVLPIPAVALALRQILRQDGLVNHAVDSVGLDFLAQDWLVSTSLAIWTILMVIVIKELGLGMLIFTARLSGVDNELYEAARLDGARWWAQFWNITLPQLRELMGFYVVLATVTIFSWIFAYVFVLTGGGPGNTTTVLEIYLYRRMFGAGAGGRDIGTAAAVGVLLLLGIITAFALVAVVRFTIVRVRRRMAAA